MAQRKSTVIKNLEKAGYTLITRANGDIILADENQRETLYHADIDEWYYPPVYEYGYECSPHERVEAILDNSGWYLECDYPTCFILVKE